MSIIPYILLIIAIVAIFLLVYQISQIGQIEMSIKDMEKRGMTDNIVYRYERIVLRKLIRKMPKWFQRYYRHTH